MSLSRDKLPLYWGLLPSLAVLLAMYVLDEALLAVGLYHAGIIGCMIWKGFDLKQITRGLNIAYLLGLGATCLLTWPLIQLLWPVMVLPGVDLGDLLQQWGITGPAIWVFVFYSVLLHPILEESFWRGLMPDGWQSDMLFAGFHLLVLYPLIHAIWLPVVFVVLTVASWIWRLIVRQTGGLVVPILTHALADLGVILAVRGLLST